MTVIKLPQRFWTDHWERFESSEHSICREVSRTARHVTLECTAEQLAFLKADAAFYADRDNTDFEPWLRAAAKATLAAIVKAEG